MRALLSELKLGLTSWPRLVPLVHSVVIHSPLPKLKKTSTDAGIEPITAFTQLTADNPVLSLFNEEGHEDLKSLELVTARQLLRQQKIASAIDQIHKRISVNADLIRSAARERHNRLTNIRPVNFAVGDYVVGCPQLSKVSKLTVRWSGPARVVQFNLALVAVVEDLLNGKQREIHVARLKLYHDSSRNVNEKNDYLLVLSYQNKHLFLVEQFKDVRHMGRRGFDVLTSWVDFPDEDSWEPLKGLYRDVPERIQRYLEVSKKDPTAAAALRELAKLK